MMALMKQGYVPSYSFSQLIEIRKARLNERY
jgi:hypothetical protein